MLRPDWFPHLRPTGSPVKIPQIESPPNISQSSPKFPPGSFKYQMLKFRLNFNFKVPFKTVALKVVFLMDLKFF